MCVCRPAAVRRTRSNPEERPASRWSSLVRTTNSKTILRPDDPGRDVKPNIIILSDSRGPAPTRGAGGADTRLQAWKPPRCRVLRSDSQDSEVGVVQEQGMGPHETDIYSDKPKAAVLGVAELATHAGQPTACSPLLGWQPPQRHVWK